MSKTELRRTLLAKRQAFSIGVRKQWDKAIAEHISAWLKNNPVKTIGVYWPMRGEPDLHLLYAMLSMQGIELGLPMVVNQNAPLQFAAWVPGDPVVKDALAAFIPAVVKAIPIPEALLIPCVGFNQENFRLGYGGGFYDRTLAATPRPVTLGVAYSCSLAEFTSASHDVALDRIITEASAH